MGRTNTMGYILVVMDWTEEHRDRTADGKRHRDAEPSRSGYAARHLKLCVLSARDNPWTVELPGMEAPNEFVGRLGMGDEEAMADLVGMLDWSGAEGTGRLDRESTSSRRMAQSRSRGRRRSRTERARSSETWLHGERRRPRTACRITVSAHLPVRSDERRIPGVCMDVGADFVRRLSEEDRGAQAEIIEMIDCEGWNIRDVQVDAASFERGRMQLPPPAIVDGAAGEFAWETLKQADQRPLHPPSPDVHSGRSVHEGLQLDPCP